MTAMAEDTVGLKNNQDEKQSLELKTENTDTHSEPDKLNINAPGRPIDKECNNGNQDIDSKNSTSEGNRTDNGSGQEVVGEGTKIVDPEQAYAEGKISKKQLKRLRREEAWRKKKEFLKTKRKDQRRLEAQKRKEKGEPNKKRLRLEFEKRLETSDITIAVDLSFDDLMMEQDIKKLMKQIERCYAVNKRAPVPVQMHLSSLGGRCRHRMETAIAGWQGWKVGMERRLYTEVFERERIVYLTSDSPNTLSTLEPGKVYIIGGLVDHNSHKCLRSCWRTWSCMIGRRPSYGSYHSARGWKPSPQTSLKT
ncbi:TRMT10A [Branchiostoma lanceolatum]|uniref:tRNA (guanine(9)-N(1))-methyltransferase n=1 Tax=Branchiostoma lanceolatum TaxID=7740 RepID=A0A8J9Z1Y8_BRALA|nr:TRMT10A [Branchiostoma lanceolatum]